MGKRRSCDTAGASSRATKERRSDKDHTPTPTKAVATPVVDYLVKTLYGFPFNSANITNNTSVRRICRRYLQASTDVDTSVHNVIVIKSPMGSGKTTLFLDLIKKYERVLIVSSRRSYGDYMCTVVPGLVNYQTITGRISAEVHPRVVVQVQSLKRIRAIETETTFAQWDMIYIDEINGVAKEIISEVTKMAVRKKLGKFITKLVSTIPTVVVSDAGLALWHMELINVHMLSGLTRKNTLCLINDHVPRTHAIKVFDECLISYRVFNTKFITDLRGVLGNDDRGMVDVDFFFMSKNESVAKDLFVNMVYNVYKTAGQDTATGDIGQHLRRVLNKKTAAAVVCNTRSQAYLIHSLLLKTFKKKDLFVLAGDTSSDVRSTFTSDPERVLRDKRCFIYTPCLSVGVDINFDHFDEIFVMVDGMAPKNTPAIVDMFQCVGRIRKARTINLYVGGRLATRGATPFPLEDDHIRLMTQPDPLWTPPKEAETHTFLDSADTMTTLVYRMTRLEKSLNRSPRLFADVLLELFKQTIQSGEVEYMSPTLEESVTFFDQVTDLDAWTESCKELFRKRISKYTTITLDSFAEVFKGKKRVRKEALKHIVETLHLFLGDFPTSLFVLRQIDPNLLMQWAIYFRKFQYEDPAYPVDMLHFEKQVAESVGPQALYLRVMRRLFRNNKASFLTTFDDFSRAVALTFQILDDPLCCDDRKVVDELSGMLVNEYEVCVSTEHALKDLAEATGLVLHKNPGSDTNRLIMPTRHIAADIHKMAALLLL